MHRDASETLSALLDGENVDPRALREALARPDSGELLRDLALVRAEILDDASEPSEAFRRRMRASLRESARAPQRGLRWLRVAASLAAALVVVALLLWIGGRRAGERAGAGAAPPKPDRVLRFEPGTEWVSDRRGSS